MNSGENAKSVKPESVKAQRLEGVQLELDFEPLTDFVFSPPGLMRKGFLYSGSPGRETPEDQDDYYEFRGRW